ncbi:MAG: hypothetical protein JXR96_20080, partial [Deltaproteobacteria bacterium]|nr:hypothetical protein [Deltaproteobacteria bacterium]
MRLAAIFMLAWTLVSGGRARAGFTETLPRGTFLFDSSLSLSVLHHRYDNDGKKTTLIDSVQRYEPGSGLQGTLVPEAEVNYLVLINQLQYG